MWLERFVIVVISLTRDFMPSAWGRYSATVWDYATFVGTMGIVRHVDFPVRARVAGDFHRRNARIGHGNVRGTQVIEHRSHMYGVMGEFENRAAAHSRRRENSRSRLPRRSNATRRFPVEGLLEAMGLKRNMVPLITLIGGLFGGLGGFGFQYWVNVYAYPDEHRRAPAQ